MGLFVDQRSRQFFAENGAIHFENLLSDQQVTKYQEAARALVDKKMPGMTGLKPRTADDVVTRGKGLAAADETLGRLVRSRHLAEVAYELTNARPLRLGRDLLTTGSALAGALPIFKEPRTLSETVCYQGIACGVLIRLSGAGAEQESLIPAAAGAGVFLSADTAIDFSALTADPDAIFLLIVYLIDRAVLVASDLDPTPYGDRDLGYAIGDRIRDEGHPTVWR